MIATNVGNIVEGGDSASGAYPLVRVNATSSKSAAAVPPPPPVGSYYQGNEGSNGGVARGGNAGGVGTAGNNNSNNNAIGVAASVSGLGSGSAVQHSSSGIVNHRLATTTATADTSSSLSTVPQSSSFVLTFTIKIYILNFN